MRLAEVQADVEFLKEALSQAYVAIARSDDSRDKRGRWSTECPVVRPASVGQHSHVRGGRWWVGPRESEAGLRPAQARHPADLVREAPKNR